MVLINGPLEDLPGRKDMIDKDLIKKHPEAVMQNIINRRCFGMRDNPEMYDSAVDSICLDIFLLRSAMQSMMLYDRILAMLYQDKNTLTNLVKSAPKEEKAAIAQEARKCKEQIDEFLKLREEQQKWFTDKMMELPNLTINEQDYLARLSKNDNPPIEEE
jgi:seryl-tRNA synthetase